MYTMFIGWDDRESIWKGLHFQKLQDSEKFIKPNSTYETYDFVDSFPASSSIAISSFKQSYFVEPETNNIQDSFPSKLSITVSVLFFNRPIN